MKIDNSQVKVSFDFSPATHFLVYSTDTRYGEGEKVWTLNYKIDRSYKGKDDDVGDPIIYLSEQEAEQCKKAGFTYIEFEYDIKI